MAAPTVTQATVKVHEVLEPFSADERKRIVAAALTLLGDDPMIRTPATSGKAAAEASDDSASLPSAAQLWMKKNSLDMDTLEHYFHFDGGSVTPIELPANGSGKREKTIHTYLLTGVASLLSSGDSSFADETARKLCEHFGCYDSPNHASYLKKFGNQITGSKSAGWKLTAPGLSAAALSLKKTAS